MIYSKELINASGSPLEPNVGDILVTSKGCIIQVVGINKSTVNLIGNKSKEKPSDAIWATINCEDLVRVYGDVFKVLRPNSNAGFYNATMIISKRDVKVHKGSWKPTENHTLEDFFEIYEKENPVDIKRKELLRSMEQLRGKLKELEEQLEEI